MDKFQALLIAAPILGVLSGAIVEGLKRAGMASKYALLASMGLGVLIGLIAHITGILTLQEGLFAGLYGGLMMSGIYSGSKAILKK